MGAVPALTTPAAMLQRIEREQAQLRQGISLVAELVRAGNLIERTIALQNAAPVLDLLQQAGQAEARFFSATQTIAANATVAAVVSVQPGPGNVGFWRFLTVEPDQSRIFSMTMNIDGAAQFTNTSVVPGELIPSSIWLPYYASFTVDFTNNDAIATHTINVVGLRVFLRLKAWQRIKGIMDKGLGLLCGQELCQGAL